MADHAKPTDAITTSAPEPQPDNAAAITSVAERDAEPLRDGNGYRTVPDQETTGWPPGIPFIVGNEACERFSFYGMKAILFVHLVALYTAAGYAEGRASELGRSTFHLFVAGSYALPMIGAIIADRFAGKFRTILYISLFYCLGHAVLSGWESSLTGVGIGLALIAFGAGGIKPCVSANVGDQFGKGNWFRVRTVYQIFYFSINFGSFFATISIPRVKEFSGPYLASMLSGWRTFTPEEQGRLGTSVAFAIPGILMFVATLIFWLGRHRFVHVPPKPGGKLGLLDTLSSVALFLTFGHLFFTRDRPWYELLAYSALSLIVGLALFSWRQRLAPDDGFLAVSLYTIKRLFAPAKQPAPAAIGSNGADGPNLSPARARFWRPAVERFGIEAAEAPVAVLKIISILFFISVFWALFELRSSTWIEQAQLMDLSLHGLDETLSFRVPGLGWTFKPLPSSVLANEIQAANPLLIMLLIPLMNALYAGCARLGLPTPALLRMTVGLFVMAISFVAVALIQRRVDAAGSDKVWFVWQMIPYVLLTTSEVMVSITALEFAYTQAPRRMKSTIMSFLNLTVTFGNVLVAVIAYFAGLSLVNTFWFFAGLMALTGVLFSVRSLFYIPKEYPQG